MKILKDLRLVSYQANRNYKFVTPAMVKIYLAVVVVGGRGQLVTYLRFMKLTHRAIFSIHTILDKLVCFR